MVDLPLKSEGGGQEQFTLTTSVALDANPLFFMKDGSGTLVYSSAGASSGAGFYYEYASIPSSKGLYSGHWWYTINAQSFQEQFLFEVVQTLAFQTTGQYCNFVDVVNLYEPLRDMDMAYHEIDDKIQDVQARMDARLGVRYSVPFATGANSLPPVVKTLAKNLTLVDIMRSKGKAPDWIDDLKMESNSLLGAIADGNATLVLTDGTTLGQSFPDDFGQADHNFEDYTPTFNMLDWSYQRIDPDRLDDEEDDL